MVTTYQIFCSCGCGEIIERKVFKSGACKVRAYRDTIRQTVILNNGDPVIKGNFQGYTSSDKVKPLVTMKPKVTENVKPLVTDWHPTYNPSKGHFTRKK